MTVVGHAETVPNRLVWLGNEESSAHTKLALLLARRTCASPWVGTLAVSIRRAEVRQPWPELPQPHSLSQLVGEDPSITEIPE